MKSDDIPVKKAQFMDGHDFFLFMHYNWTPEETYNAEREKKIVKNFYPFYADYASRVVRSMCSNMLALDLSKQSG